MRTVTSTLLLGVGADLNKTVLADTYAAVVAGLIYLFAGPSLALVQLSPPQRKIMLLIKKPAKTEKGSPEETSRY